MKQQDHSVMELEKISQQWVLSETSIQGLLDLEVDLVVLCRELTNSVESCIKTAELLRALQLQPLSLEDS